MASRGPKAKVVAYADDVTIFITSPADIPIINDALRKYEATSGARVNIRKSKAIAVSRWDTSLQIMGIPYYETKILVFHITSTGNASARRSWDALTDRIRAQAREAYTRELNLDGRIYYVHTHLMAKAWYFAQIFQPHEASIKRLNTVIAWLIWKGAIFRVPLSTLQRSKDDGGWDMIHLKAKCIALLLHRTRIQSQNPEIVTAAWLEKWSIIERSPNPPHRGEIPATIDYLRRIYMESAYAPPYDKTVTNRVYKRRLYTTVHAMIKAEAGSQELRISRLKPNTHWGAVCRNLHDAPVPQMEKSGMVQGDT